MILEERQGCTTFQSFLAQFILRQEGTYVLSNIDQYVKLILQKERVKHGSLTYSSSYSTFSLLIMFVFLDNA